MSRRVIVYELNEVPWRLVDHYVGLRPHSTLAALLGEGSCRTTVCEDPEPLQPWRTWPTFHSSNYTREHGSYDLGQDPSSFAGEPLWDVAERAGKVIGLFGPLQSWPARPVAPPGFYVPDTFARTPETVPRRLEPFQAFNLKMTKDNTFSADSKLSVAEMARAGFALMRCGMTARSAVTVASHLVDEVRDTRHKGSRPVMQALPSFDLFWRLHTRSQPDLSIFFTNHVASMMHRYWADGMPGYDRAPGYTPDPVFATFLLKALDVCDRQLGVIRAWMAARGETTLVVASSMGQDAIAKEDIDETFVLDRPEVLVSALGLRCQPGNAMYPRSSFLFDSEAAASAGARALASVRGPHGPLLEDIRVAARTVSVAVDQTAWGRHHDPSVSYLPVGADREISGQVADLGIVVRPRLGGGNTAYHTAEGIWIAVGGDVRPDRGREAVSILDAAPSILAALGVEPPLSYRGRPSLAV